MGVRACLVTTAALIGAANAIPASADNLTTSRVGLNGNPGILQMPTAEVAPDGDLSLNHTRFGPVKRTTLSFQITPRLSGSFSYTGTDDLTDEFDVYWDRSFDLSYRILDEGQYRPAVSIGLRDFLGTGLQGAEYIVATKSVGDKLVVSGGLGWGRLATANDLGLSFGTRDNDLLVTGGTPNFDQWFRGPVGVFGGLSYQLNDKLTLLAEYSSDAYEAEVDRGIIDIESQINVGATYKLSRGISVTAGYLHGSEFALQVSGHLNPKDPRVAGGMENAPLPVAQRPSRSADALGWSGKWIEDGTDAPGIRNALAKAMANEGLSLEAMSLTATRAEVTFRNNQYSAGAQAVGRLSRMMSRAFPPSVETFALTEVVRGVPVQTTVIRRSDLERLEFEPAGDMLASAQFYDPLAYPSDELVVYEEAYPRLTWGVVPYLTASLFDPDSPVRADFGLQGKINYQPAPGVELRGTTALLISGNVGGNEFETDPDSGVPLVRSDIAGYSDRLQIPELTANYYAHPAPNVFTRVSLGYLERMYGGASAEVLWKKPENPYAIGAELNYVRKRAYDDLFAFQDYDVVTGHVSGYMSFGNGFHGQVDVGRYLAGDWGATVALDREFNNGWRVGAYATLTDIPFEDFGEGSFDKGIRLSLPVDWFVGTPTKETREFQLKSLSRDGGARLNVNGRLYERVRNAQQSELETRWGRFWR